MKRTTSSYSRPQVPCAVLKATARKKPRARSLYRARAGDSMWEKVQRQYVDFLSDWRRTDLGSKQRNFHNGVGGTYELHHITSYYLWSTKAVTSFREIERWRKITVLPTFHKLKFVDCNKPLRRKLIVQGRRLFVRKAAATNGTITRCRLRLMKPTSLFIMNLHRARRRSLL